MFLAVIDSRKEVESLGDRKKGWQKAPKTKNSNPNILADEIRKKELQTDAGNSLRGKFVVPRTPLELDRDWRRLPASEKLG